MNCTHVKDLICDYPIETGDIICTTCPHYLKKDTKPSFIRKSWNAFVIWIRRGDDLYMKDLR